MTRAAAEAAGRPAPSAATGRAPRATEIAAGPPSRGSRTEAVKKTQAFRRELAAALDAIASKVSKEVYEVAASASSCAARRRSAPAKRRSCWREYTPSSRSRAPPDRDRQPPRATTRRCVHWRTAPPPDAAAFASPPSSPATPRPRDVGEVEAGRDEVAGVPDRPPLRADRLVHRARGRAGEHGVRDGRRTARGRSCGRAASTTSASSRAA